MADHLTVEQTLMRSERPHEHGTINPHESVVPFNTGGAAKYLDALPAT